MYGHDHKIMNPAERRVIQLYNVQLYIYVCVCVFVFQSACVYQRVCVCEGDVYVFVSVPWCISVCASVFPFVCACVYVCVCARVFVCVYIKSIVTEGIPNSKP